ncbi:hypothetical protein FOZ62_017240, partial [Perkinsus olseni]
VSITDHPDIEQITLNIITTILLQVPSSTSTPFTSLELSKDDITMILSHAIKQCDINPSLIREVDLGPFKHKQDDGLPLRKASYTCLTAFLTTSSYPFIAHTTLHYLCHNRCQTEEQGEEEITLADLLIKGSQDHEDIQGLCCELLC